MALCRSCEREVDGQQEVSSSSSSSSSWEGEDHPPEGEDHAEGAEAVEAAASEGNLAVRPEEERMLLDSEPTEAGESPTAAVVTWKWPECRSANLPRHRLRVVRPLQRPRPLYPFRYLTSGEETSE